jgi:hypothetical protein
MNELLKEFFVSILVEVSIAKQSNGTVVNARGNRLRAKNMKGKIDYYENNERKEAQIWARGTEPPRQAEPETEPTRKGTAKKAAARKVSKSAEDVTELNADSLAALVRDGFKAPGNDFSKYSEAVSTLIAKKVVANVDTSPEELLASLVKLDCESKTLSSEVKVSIPKRSSHYAEFKRMEESGIFEDNCDKQYSEAQNMARYMTMVVAQTKGTRMYYAIDNLQRNGDLKGDVIVDSFSGDQNSLANLRKLVQSVPQGAKIFTESGEEIDVQRVMTYIDGFGKAEFPADTVLLARDGRGNLVFMGFSDKQELSAIINNTTVSVEFQTLSDSITELERLRKIDEKDARAARQSIEKTRVEYEAIEAELVSTVSSPARKMVSICRNAAKGSKQDKKILSDVIRRMKAASDSKTNPEKYWQQRIEVFGVVATKDNPNKKDEENYLQWLRKAGWNGKSKPTETQMVMAWALRTESRLKSENEKLPDDDASLLLRSGIVDVKQIKEEVSKIRLRALTLLQKNRDRLNRYSVDGIPAGNYLDAMSAFNALHLEMGDYNGALSLVAGDVVVDHDAIQHCLKGIKDVKSFAKSLEITSKDIVDKSYGTITGRRVEVFSITPRGSRVDVGVKSIRSKEGLLGKLQVTWNYHPEFQSCLKQQMKVN